MTDQSRDYMAYGIYGASGARASKAFMGGLTLPALEVAIEEAIKRHDPTLAIYSGVDVLTPTEKNLIVQYYLTEEGVWFKRWMEKDKGWVQMTMDVPPPPKPAPFSSALKQKVDAYTEMLARLEPEIVPVDNITAFASMALSLKRIADTLEAADRHYGWSAPST